MRQKEILGFKENYILRETKTKKTFLKCSIIKKYTADCAVNVERTKTKHIQQRYRYQYNQDDNYKGKKYGELSYKLGEGRQLIKYTTIEKASPQNGGGM